MIPDIDDPRVHARRFLAVDRVAELAGRPYNRAYCVGLAAQYGLSEAEVLAVVRMTARQAQRVADGLDAPLWIRVLRFLRVAA